jgi:CheY-like chemotaxis protein
VVDSGPQALDILRRSVPGTFQLILTVRGCDMLVPGGRVGLAPCVHACVHVCATLRPRTHRLATLLHLAACPLQDVMMPDVDGLELLRYVRSNHDLSSLPVISG